ncbi:hypothetical protein R80B4_01994 [Fibrobacteres bacterium R8-0-B4]
MNDEIIHEIRLAGQHNDAHFQFHTEAAALIGAADHAALHIDDGLVAKHAAQLAELDGALKKIVKSPVTAQIHEADRKRDDAYKGLAAFNNAMRLHSEPVIREAAERVQIVIDTYGNVVKKSYEEESSAVYNLVQDLISPKYAPDAAAAGLTPWVTKLGAANTVVSALVANRDNEAAAQNHTNVREARTVIDRTYKKIAARVNSHAGEDATAAVKEFVTKMNLIVKRFNTLMKQQHSHHHGSGGGTAEGGSEE